MVAEAFLGKSNPTMGKTEVNHLDCNPHNNHMSNLEWCTREENERHKTFMEGHIGITEDDATGSITESQVG